jgi:hypothetical protein
VKERQEPDDDITTILFVCGPGFADLANRSEVREAVCCAHHHVQPRQKSTRNDMHRALRLLVRVRPRPAHASGRRSAPSDEAWQLETNDPQVEISCSLKKIVGALAVVLWRLAGLNLMLKATTGLANVSGTEFD